MTFFIQKIMLSGYRKYIPSTEFIIKHFFIKYSILQSAKIKLLEHISGILDIVL